MTYSRHQQVDAFLRRHLAKVELDRKNDTSAAMHPPEEHSDAVLSFVGCPFLPCFRREAALPQKQLPVHGPAFDPERCLEELTMRVIAVHVVELEMVAGDELMEDCGARECRTVTAHTHQFVFVGHAARWVGDNDSLAAEEERIDLLAFGCHHRSFPEVSGNRRYSYEIVFLYVGDCFIGEIADQLRSQHQ